MCMHTRSGKPRGYPRVLLAPRYLADIFQSWGGKRSKLPRWQLCKGLPASVESFAVCVSACVACDSGKPSVCPPFLLSLLRVRPERNSCDSSRGQRFVAQVLSLS